MICCSNPAFSLPEKRCTCPSNHVVPPFGDKALESDRKYRIILWRTGDPLRGLLWTYTVTDSEDYDAIVTEEWINRSYEPGEVRRQVQLATLAREIGLIDNNEFGREDF